MSKKKQYVVEEGIFNIYPDFPILINENVSIDDMDRPLHFHYYLEIGFCQEGCGEIRSNTKRYKIQENGISITASNILHSVHSVDRKKDMKLAYFYIDFEDLIKMFPVGQVKTQLIFVKDSLEDILYLNGEKSWDILWIVNEIIRLYREKRQSYKMQIVGLVYTMLLKIYDAFAHEVKCIGKNKDLPIMPAINYIYDYYMEQIKVAKLAEVCHFSESYFRKIFLEMKGMSPMDYLHSIRIREACRMLLNTTDTVRVVGEKCGYLSVTTFERNFKQRTGMLPSQWRESQVNPNLKDRNRHMIKRMYQFREDE